jgi:ABC-2 type transport system permease protein
MTLGRELLAVARLDLAEVLRSRWMVFCGAVYALLAGVFVLVGLRESTLLGFSGMGRVLLSFCHALVLLLPLLALTATGQVINRAREDGSLELFFSQPLRRGTFFAAVTLVRSAVLVGPLVVLMVAMAVIGSVAYGQVVPWGFLLRALAVSTALLLAFVGLGMAVSTLVRSQARAMIWLLTLWALGVALIDFGLVGLMLQWRLNPRTVFLLASLNPVQAARMALLSGAAPDLGVLGPVGFFLAHRLGGTVLFAAGTLWPVLVGAGAWMLALRSFRRGDLV